MSMSESELSPIGAVDEEIARAEIAWGRLISAIERAPIDRTDEAGVCGEWSLKTLVCHIDFWDAFELEHIANRAELGQVDWQSLNVQHDNAFAGRTFANAVAEMKSTHAKLVAHVGAISNLEPGLVRELMHDHYVEHAAEIESWIDRVS
jgi:hypothetical protein